MKKLLALALSALTLLSTTPTLAAETKQLEHNEYKVDATLDSWKWYEVRIDEKYYHEVHIYNTYTFLTNDGNLWDWDVAQYYDTDDGMTGVKDYVLVFDNNGTDTILDDIMTDVIVNPRKAKPDSGYTAAQLNAMTQKEREALGYIFQSPQQP